MKRIFLFLIIVLSTQLSFAQVSYGVHADIISAHQDAIWYANKTSSMLFWKAGVVSKFPFSNHFTLMPQLNFIIKGGKASFDSDADHNKYEEKLTYLELPVYALYTIKRSKSTSFFIGGGPIISYGLNGDRTGTEEHVETTGSNIFLHVARPIKFDGRTYNENDQQLHYNPMELALGIIGGYQFSKALFVKLHYSFGTTNLGANIGAETKNNYGGLGLGYIFPAKHK